MICNIMEVVFSRDLEEARDLIENIRVGHSIGIVETWGVDECDDAAIWCGCGPEIDTNLRRLGLDSMSDFDSFVASDELDELYVE